METLLLTQTDHLPFTPGQRVLYVHAHPDDETVATGEAIEQSVEAGAETFTALATFGSANSNHARSLRIVHAHQRNLQSGILRKKS